jgi:hypothetical protein
MHDSSGNAAWLGLFPVEKTFSGRVNCAVIRSGIKNAHRSGPYIVAGQST